MNTIKNHESEQLDGRKNLSSNYAQSSRSLPLKFLNQMAGFLQHHGIGVAKLSADLLMEKAVRKMGLSDWGETEFQEPLQTLVDAIDHESQLDYLGKFFFENWIFNLLCNRLCIQDEIKSNPAIMQEEIRRPVFNVGLSRTGTTLLHNLLCLDPSVRFLRSWEASAPALHPRARLKKIDNREKQLRLFLWILDKIAPQLATAHEITADGPDECTSLLLHTFVSDAAWENTGLFQTYVEWLKNADKLPSYKYYRTILQLLQSHHAGDHWVLKSGMHLASLEVLLKTFPDACIIQTHRDPCKAIPSACSLFAIGTQPLCGTKLDLKHIGRVVSDIMIRNLDEAMVVRGKNNHYQFLDVQYHDMMKDPHGAVRKVYDYFGYPYGAHMDRRITLWLAKNKQHKKGKHSYSPEQFGLSISEIRERTARYVDTYNIPRED
jgi:hypothetical protein